MVIKVELHRIDGDGVVEIPNGSTVLGRGPFLGCDDKRISRNHAALELRETGDVFLVSKHVNPCYLLKKDGEVVKDAITKDSSVELKDGYHFSLLHDSYTYAVSIAEECSPTLSMPDDDDDEKGADEAVEKDKSSSPPNKNLDADEKKEEASKDADSTATSSNQNKENGGKKRVLPNWMSQSSSLSTDGSKPAGWGKATGGQTGTKGKNQEGTTNVKQDKDVNVGHDKKEPVKNNTQTTPKKKGTPRKRDLSDSESGSPKQSPKKKQVASDKATPKKTDISDSDSESVSPKQSPKKKIQVTPVKATQRKRDISDSESDNESSERTPKKRKTDPESSRETPTPKKTPNKLLMSDSEEEEDIGAIPTSSKEDQRVPCQYGSKCYRKNADHRKEFSHPGDDDYVDYKSDGEEEDEDKPECEYGTTCYRKNPHHRKQYKHTHTPKQQRRAKKEAKKLKKWRDAGDPELDEYDYDDPFLNDASSDDYQPTDSESESEPSQSLDADEEDNLRRTLKEAKRFTR